MDRAQAGPTRRFGVVLVPLLRAQRARLGVIGGCSLGNGLIEAGVLILVARIAFALTRSGRAVEAPFGPLGSIELSVPLMIGIAGAAVAVKLVLQGLIAWQTAWVSRALTTTVRHQMTSRFLNASWALQSEDRQGHLQELTTTYTSYTTAAVVAAVRRTAGHPKGHRHFIDVFASVAGSRPNARLLLVGKEGTASSQLREQLRSLGDVRGQIRLLGHRDVVPELLAAADVFALRFTLARSVQRLLDLYSRMVNDASVRTASHVARRQH